ncbi:hypothetical protein ACFXHA_41715 [Nocardia sp. NPDC059240]|uniref:hypothetical protein n=1 Tax=Nocardia sp. NPDC059240 TaxID=3346786 RepID=UPI0036AF77BC
MNAPVSDSTPAARTASAIRTGQAAAAHGWAAPPCMGRAAARTGMSYAAGARRRMPTGPEWPTAIAPQRRSTGGSVMSIGLEATVLAELTIEMLAGVGASGTRSTVAALWETSAAGHDVQGVQR